MGQSPCPARARPQVVPSIPQTITALMNEWRKNLTKVIGTLRHDQEKAQTWLPHTNACTCQCTYAHTHRKGTYTMYTYVNTHKVGHVETPAIPALKRLR